MSEQRKQTIARISEFIYEGFLKYNESFTRITERARRRFEQQDWGGHHQDIAERVELYEKSVRRIVISLRKNLGPRVNDPRLWHSTRGYFGERLYNVPDAGFQKTFFNSITRRIFDTVGIDSSIEFVSSAPDEGFNPLETLTLNRYPYWGSLSKTFKKFSMILASRSPIKISLRIAGLSARKSSATTRPTCAGMVSFSGLNLSTRRFFNRPGPI